MKLRLGQKMEIENKAKALDLLIDKFSTMDVK